MFRVVPGSYEADERKVALKFLPETVTADPEAVRDLKRETKRCLDLTHPNIVRVHDLEQDGPMAAIAMEFVAGQSLAKRKAEVPGGCLTVKELAPLVAHQLCAALDYAHGEAKDTPGAPPSAHPDQSRSNWLTSIFRNGKSRLIA